jgi:hypothetical protein
MNLILPSRKIFNGATILTSPVDLQRFHRAHHLVDVGDERFALRRVLTAEFLQVPLAMVPGPRPEGGAGVEEEGPGRWRPGHHGEAERLHGLAEVVGAGDQVEQPAPRDLVPAADLLEPEGLRVRGDVDLHPPGEERDPSEAARQGGRGGRAVRAEHDGADLHVGVEEVEPEGAGGDEDGHGCRGAAQAEEAERVEERAVDIVARVEHGGENYRERGREQQPPRRWEEERREPQGGALHEEPRERRRQRGAPPRGGELPVRRRHEAQRQHRERAEQVQRHQAPREHRIAPGRRRLVGRSSLVAWGRGPVRPVQWRRRGRAQITVGHGR